MFIRLLLSAESAEWLTRFKTDELADDPCCMGTLPGVLNDLE